MWTRSGANNQPCTVCITPSRKPKKEMPAEGHRRGAFSFPIMLIVAKPVIA